MFLTGLMPHRDMGLILRQNRFVNYCTILRLGRGGNVIDTLQIDCYTGYYLNLGGGQGVYVLRCEIHTDAQIEEKLVDYLNFFGFVATLRQLRQLSVREIQMMFF